MSYVNLLSGSLEKATSGSACYDIRTTITDDLLLYPDTTYWLPTGIVTSFSHDLVGIIKEKSGLALEGLEVHAGVIDNDYTKEWMIVVSTRKAMGIRPGQKIAQVLFVTKSSIAEVGAGWVHAQQERTGGFGSTGL